MRSRNRLISKGPAVKNACIALVSAGALLVAAGLLAAPTAGAQGTVREFSVKGDQFAFSPTRIEVHKDDIVKITFTAVDIPHSFTMDGGYRIAKRASAGQTITFEFRANATERFYCNLTQDERCSRMHGELVIK